jgi:hypothetical protein
VPCFAHGVRCCGGSCATTSWPAGGIGWAAKSISWPWMPCHAEMDRSEAKDLMWLRVSSMRDSRAGQRLGGKEI